MFVIELALIYTTLKYSVKLPITYQQLEGDGFHIFTEIKIFGDTHFALIDTGASKTVFASTLINKYPQIEIIEIEDNNIAAGIGEGNVEAQMAKFPLIELGRAKVHNLYCGLIALDHVKETYQAMDLKPFDVIIGGDILKLLQAEINYKSHYIKLQPLSDVNEIDSITVG